MFFILRGPNLVYMFLNLIVISKKNSNSRGTLGMTNHFQKPSFDIKKSDSQAIVSKSEHLKRDCQKLLYKTQRSQHAQITSTNNMGEQSVTNSTGDLLNFKYSKNPCRHLPH